MRRGTNFLDTVATGTSARVTPGVVIPDYARHVGVFIPDVHSSNNPNLGLEVSWDGTNWFPVIDPTDGQDLVIMATTYDPCYRDLSDYLAAISQKRDPDQAVSGGMARITSDGDMADAVVFRWCFKE